MARSRRPARASRRNERWPPGGSLRCTTRIIVPRVRAHRTEQLCLRNYCVFDESLRRKLPDAAYGAQDLHFQYQPVPGHDRLLETRLIDADEVIHAPAVALQIESLEGEYRGGLRHRLDDQHARHDGIA